MSITYNSRRSMSEGDLYRVFSNISPDTSYPTGGYAMSPAQLGLSRISAFTVVNNPAGLMFLYNQTTGKLIIGSVSGGGGGLSFTGTPMAAHGHVLNHHIETIPVQTGLCLTMVLGTGSYTPGETITGGTSGATGIVSSFSSGNLFYLVTAGIFRAGEVVTGGTSGVTYTTATTPYKVYNAAPSLSELSCGFDSDITHRNFLPTPANGNTPWRATINTIVGTFTPTETITGAPSGATGKVITFIAEGGQLEYTKLGGTFQLNDTLTGGSSGATAKLASCYKENLMVYLPTANRITIDSEIGPDELSIIGLASNSVANASAGTPAGTVSGGGGGSFAELANGTNVSAIVSQFDIIVEGY